MSNPPRKAKLDAKLKLEANRKLYYSSSSSDQSIDQSFQSCSEHDTTLKYLKDISALFDSNESIKSENHKMAGDDVPPPSITINKPSLAKEVLIVPIFKRRNVLKFIACAKHFETAMKAHYDYKLIVEILITRLEDQDFILASTQTFESYAKFIEFITTRGVVYRPSSTVLQEIFALRQGNSESLIDYSARVDQLKAEYELTEKITNKPPLFAGEAFSELLVKMTVQGLKTVYRLKCSEDVNLSYDELRVYLRKSTSELFAHINHEQRGENKNSGNSSNFKSYQNNHQNHDKNLGGFNKNRNQNRNEKWSKNFGGNSNQNSGYSQKFNQNHHNQNFNQNSDQNRGQFQNQNFNGNQNRNFNQNFNQSRNFDQNDNRNFGQGQRDNRNQSFDQNSGYNSNQKNFNQDRNQNYESSTNKNGRNSHNSGKNQNFQSNAPNQNFPPQQNKNGWERKETHNQRGFNLNNEMRSMNFNDSPQNQEDQNNKNRQPNQKN